jgi:hypothetical protein
MDPHPLPPDPLRSTIERALGAQYDVLRLVGRGGMGAVYLARERLLERLVAVKVLPHEAALQGGGRERFLREARTAARLSHPNIVPLHSFAEQDGTFLYVMGFIEGESLESRLARDVKLPADDTRRILAEIADALEYAHTQGVVHRDVKPDNILIESGTGRAVLTDFGIAKAGAHGQTLTQTGMIVGTPHYMSPEQASADQNIDGRSDIYALGVIGYRMICGRLPFEGESVQAVLTQHVMKSPVPLTSTDETRGLDTAVMRCLEKEPKDRWPTAAAFARACRPSEHEIELPDEIAIIPSMGTRGIATVAAMAFGITLLEAYQAGDASRGGPEVLAIFGTLAVILSGMFAYFAFKAKRHGIAPRAAVRMMFWPPASWFMWWPHSLRRPGDVWPRLPTRIRVNRIMLTASMALMFGVTIPGMLYVLVWSVGDNPPLPAWLGRWVFSYSMMVWAPLMFIPLISAASWRKRYRLSDRLANRLLQEPTWNNPRFWERPEIAAVLERVMRATASTTPQTPVEYVAAIAAAASALPEAIRPALSEVSDTARELATHIAALDAELAELSRDADPAERAKLEQKVSAMGSRAGQLRDLLVGQIALLDTLDARRRQLGDDRARYVAMLKSVWLQVASLRAENAQASLSATEITGRVRALRDELERQRAARVEVEHAMLGPTIPSGDPVKM